MSAKNYYVRNNDPEKLKTLAEEYQSMGRDIKIDGTTLTVHALKQKVSKPKKEARSPRPRGDQ